MTNAYQEYFNSQEKLKIASSLLNQKDYRTATTFLSQARDSAKQAFNEPVLVGNAIQSFTTCSILLIATHIRRQQKLQAYEFQQESVEQLTSWLNQAETQPLEELCRYCYQLLITGCQHSRCLGHCMQQLEESGYAHEQT